MSEQTRTMLQRYTYKAKPEKVFKALTDSKTVQIFDKILSFQDIIVLGYDEKTVQKVIASVDKNEYKRRQAPPGIKITPRAFGKDRRLPITNRYTGL